MTVPEVFPGANPADKLAETIASRQQELNFLLTGLRNALPVLSDLTNVNATLQDSQMPELVLTERAAMAEITDPVSLKLANGQRINNFDANLCMFGMLDPAATIRSGNLRPFTENERQAYFTPAALGGCEQWLTHATAQGISLLQAKFIYSDTHLNKAAFMRMWVLFPDLTTFIMDSTVSSPENKNKNVREETFVAYTIMSRLVDKRDERVIKADGSVDDWYLCH